MQEFGPGFQSKLLEYLSDRPDAMRWASLGFSVGATLGTIAPAIVPASWPVPSPLSLGILLGGLFAAVYLALSGFDLEKCLAYADRQFFYNRIKSDHYEKMKDDCVDRYLKRKA